MIRKTLTILSFIGLLLSVGLWGVSIVGMGFYEKFSSHLLSVSWVARGSLHVSTFALANPQSYAPAVESRFFVILGGNFRIAPNKKTTWQLLPVFWSPDLPLGQWSLSVPLYIGILLFGAYPLWMALPFHRRRKRMKLGLCLKCGYDLRASKDRCPECGAGFPE